MRDDGCHIACIACRFHPAFCITFVSIVSRACGWPTAQSPPVQTRVDCRLLKEVRTPPWRALTGWRKPWLKGETGPLTINPPDLDPRCVSSFRRGHCLTARRPRAGADAYGALLHCQGSAPFSQRRASNLLACSLSLGLATSTEQAARKRLNIPHKNCAGDSIPVFWYLVSRLTSPGTKCSMLTAYSQQARGYPTQALLQMINLLIAQRFNSQPQTREDTSGRTLSR